MRASKNRSSLHRVLVTLFVAPCLALVPVTVGANDDHKESSNDREIVTLPADAVMDRDYFAAGPTVEISGVVNGDVYAAGGQILVEGTINGDLLAAGGIVTISGTVSQDVRLVGGQTTLDGRIGRNVTIASGTVDITNAAEIGGSLVAAGGTVRVSAPVGGDAKLAAGTVTISDRIAGNLEAAVGVLRLTSNAVVTGDLTYWSQARASIDKQAQIGGAVTRGEFPEHWAPSAGGMLAALVGLKLLLVMTSFVSTLALGLLFLHFYPHAMQTAVSHLTERPLASLGLGFLALIATPLIAMFLGMTIVGLPLAVIVVAWLLIVMYMGRIFVIHWAGCRVFAWFGKEASERWAFVTGLAIYSVMTLIPFLGELLITFVVLFGLGTTLLMKRDIYVAARNQAMI